MWISKRKYKEYEYTITSLKREVEKYKAMCPRVEILKGLTVNDLKYIATKSYNLDISGCDKADIIRDILHLEEELRNLGEK